MKTFWEGIRAFWKNEKGAELVEWIVFVAVLVLGIVTAVVLLRNNINSGYAAIGTTISSAAASG